VGSVRECPNWYVRGAVCRQRLRCPRFRCRSQRPTATQGLNPRCNRTLKEVFKSAALGASVRGAFKLYYDRLVAQEMRPQLAQVTLARKIAAVTLAVELFYGHAPQVALF
jgi:hypothetical protein